MSASELQSFSETVRILLAEDNADITRIVTFYLQNMRNAEVHACKDGGEAMAALTEGSFDIAILDGNMPVDGLTVLRWMREQSVLVSVPVIFLTANHDSTFKKDCLAGGAQLVITKPFNPGELVRQVRTLLAARSQG